MKKRLLSTLLLAGFTLFFFACSSGGGNQAADSGEEAAAAESTEEAADQTAVVLPFGQLLFAWHAVEDYNTWKTVYDQVEHSIDTDGLEKLFTGAESGNPNNVFVAEIVHNAEAALAFFDSGDFAAKAEEARITGEVEMNFLDVVYIGPPAGQNPQRVVHSFNVTDFAAFSDVFQAKSQVAGGAGQDHGAQLQFIGRNSEDPNKVTMYYILDDRARLDARMASDDWKAVLEKATVDQESLVTRFLTLADYNYTE